MASHVLTAALLGLDAFPIQTEADIAPGMPGFSIVGLPDAAVQESRERVRSAMKHAGYSFPRTRLTVNLAPADLRKSGTAFDLPLAIAILQASGEVPDADENERLFVGELALDGSLRRVPGVLSCAMLAKRLGVKEMIVPKENADEAALIPGLVVRAATKLADVVDHLREQSPLPQHPSRALELKDSRASTFDMSAIRGQEQAKRAVEIAAAGGHNILLQGPPGSGKTLLARAMAGILPSLTVDESLEATRIHSVAGRLPPEGYLSVRPFRSPHHSASSIALVGGGTVPRPGEISLAHRGILFLDELPEFPRPVLEHLRQPLEDGFVSVSRAHGTVTFPSRVLLVAAMNPCPCGFSTDPGQACNCSPIEVERYRKRLSGPLLDRMDLLIEVPRVPPDKLTDLEPGENSDTVRARVQAARDRQIERYQEHGIVTNAELLSDQVRRLIIPSAEGRELLEAAVNRFRLSARGYFRLLKVSRTIADLAASETVESGHVAEALRYRQIHEN